jgi:hypothetical protein
LKKAPKIILPLILIGMIFSAPNVHAAYNVTVGSTFNYDVNASNTDITFGVNEVHEEGYTLEGQDFGIDTEVMLNVTLVIPTGLTYNISSGEYSELGQSTILDMLIFMLYMVYPIVVLEEVTLNTWNQNDMEDLHLGILMIPFVSITSTTWTEWIDIVDDINENGTLISDPYDGLELQAKYTNATDDFIVELNIRGDLSGDITSGTALATVDVGIDHKFLFAYTKTSGVMQGMKMEGDINGISNGTLLDIGYSYDTEKVGYDLPDYDLDRATWPFPGFGFWLTIGTISSLVVLVPIIRKRK